MDKLSSSKLKFNPKRILSKVKKVDTTYVTLDDIRVIFPDRYINANLASIGSIVTLISVYIIVDKDHNYAIVNKPIKVEMDPVEIGDIEIDGSINKVLYFNTGDIIIPNTVCQVTDTFLYAILDEFIIKGNTPWFLSYGDLSKVFITSDVYSGSKLGKALAPFNALTMLVCRDVKDPKISLRHKLTKPTDFRTMKFTVIGLKNPFYSYDNTISKVVGSYASDGQLAAIVEPETSAPDIENILRA